METTLGKNVRQISPCRRPEATYADSSVSK